MPARRCSGLIFFCILLLFACNQFPSYCFLKQIESRRTLVAVQRRLVEVLVAFVARNPPNQALVWGEASGVLMRLTGPLQLPQHWPEDFGPEHQVLVVVAAVGKSMELGGDTCNDSNIRTAKASRMFMCW